MKTETKNALYSLLDLMDILGSIEFLKIDIDKANRIRKEVLSIIDNKGELSILNSDSEDLIGVLPKILFDENKFTSTKEILKFAETCLNIEIKPYWFKRSKSEVVGIVIGEVNSRSPEQFNKFLNAWNRFSNIPDNMKYNTKEKMNFIETWFNFFENYKDMR